MPNNRPMALITGASCGIGEALAHCFAAGGHDLVLVARSADKLRALARRLEEKHQILVSVMPADLAQPDGVSRLCTALQRKRRVRDVLVNRAATLASRSTPKWLLRRVGGLLARRAG